jgi:hypothetical protein
MNCSRLNRRGQPARLLSAALVAALSLASGLTAAGEAANFRPQAGSFALIGDTPYGASREAQFDRVIEAINAAPQVRFVIHTGDIKAGSERCDDVLLEHRFEQFQNFDMPFILTPGDNDWTDCHRSNNGSYLPTERLVRLRQIFYPQPGFTTGQRQMQVVTQAADERFEDYVENMLWSFGGATIATLHVIGSNNNLAPWSGIDSGDSYASPRADRIAEYAAREAANLAWIDRVFQHAAQSHARGVLIAMQANPNFELPASDQERAGFNAILDAITEQAIAFGKPVVIAHGDSHYFRVDKPLVAPTAAGGAEMLENVTRVENFGSQYVHWVEIAVNPRDENVFSVTPHIVKENNFAR